LIGKRGAGCDGSHRRARESEEDRQGDFAGQTPISGGTDGLHDSPLEGGVRCELVSVAADEFLESIKKGSKTH
jgi:hypothetical protein